jgi:hypothetical protein
MRYLITTNNGNPPFLTNWYEYENHFNKEIDMIVYDLYKRTFTTDGETWKKIEIDHL